METARRRLEEPRVPATAGAPGGGRVPAASRPAAAGRKGSTAGRHIDAPPGARGGGMRRPRVRTVGTGCGGRPSGEPSVAGVAGRYHYLGWRVPFGANLRYWARNRDRELACLLWTSPAWKMQARDAWIGWSDRQRQRNLQRIVNHSRFLILPWVHVKGLASKILAHSARQMPHDWQTRYGVRPLLLETLVDAARFRGTCYRAANWIHLGQTSGRGRLDREHTAHGKAVKDIFVYPLAPDARPRLCYVSILHGK